MGHEEYKDMLELAALNALDESETRLLQQHLETCAECRVELAELRDTAAALVYRASPIPASAALRARVLESIKEPGMRSTSESSAADDDSEAGRTADEPSSVTPKVVPLSQRHR